jgi:anthranilate synthase component 1
MKTISFEAKYLKDAQLFYRDYCHHDHSILFESAEIVAKSGVQSIIGVSTALKVSCENLVVKVEALNHNGLTLLSKLAALYKANISDNFFTVAFSRPPKNLDEATRLKAPGPLDVMRSIQHLVSECQDILIAGVISFDFINNFEYIGDVPKGENPCDDYCYYICDIAILVNHIEKTTRVVSYAFSADTYKETAFKALELRDELNDFKAEDLLQIELKRNPKIDPDLSDSEFGAIVSKLKEHIVKGDAFQVVPSRTFKYPCPDPLLAYSYLKKLNPSPYMYYIKDPKFCILGASPEFALRFNAKTREVAISPIAGTRTRGLDAQGNLDRELDSRIELELRTDKKEVSEHLMLVDLARNDLARIAKSGSRYVDNLLHVDKYQSVMHLVSDVHATLRDDLDAFHAYLACMNMGTLSGAPKIKAHELIYRYEGKKRGSYGGVINIIAADGSFNSCIAIRSAFVKNNTAYVQAGCGVVFDSDVKAECQETINKARSVLTALDLALKD